MNYIAQQIISAVVEAKQWGVLRTNGLISAQQFEQMAALVGMSTKGGYQFRNSYFADGTTDLNPKAITAISLMFGIERTELEQLNNNLK